MSTKLLTDLQHCVLLTIRETPGIRAKAIETSWRVAASFRAMPPSGRDAEVRAIDRALKALKRAGLIRFASGWYPTAKARGAR